MATGFIQLNENDTKELRKEIGLSVTTSEDYSISNVNNKDELVEVGDLDGRENSYRSSGNLKVSLV